MAGSHDVIDSDRGQPSGKSALILSLLESMAGTTGFEPRDICRDSYANRLYLNDFIGVDG